MRTDRRLSASRMESRCRAAVRRLHIASKLATRRFRSSSLRFKITFFTVVLLTSTSLVLFVVTVQITNEYILKEIIKRGESVAKSISASAGYSLLSKDVLGLDNLVFNAKSSNSDMTYAAIFDPNGKTVADSDTPMGGGKGMPVDEGRLLKESLDGTTVVERLTPSGPILEISCPVVFMEKSLGRVVIGMDKSVLAAAKAEVGAKLIMVFGLTGVLGIVASSLLASFLIGPIEQLSAGVDEMKKGTAQQPLRIFSHDELGKLTANFNEMSALIAEQQGTLNKYARDLEDAYVSMVKVVAAAIDARDSYTHGHSARVAQLSLLIGQALKLSHRDLGDLEIACLFHDVGKIKTPDSILLKPGRLNPAERKEMMHHVEYGAAILSSAPSLVKYIPSTRHHHERHDGRGYPDGLAGNDVPLFAAIIAIADSYDAMTTDRPYRKALSVEKALREIAGMSGTQFRPDLVAVFLDQIEKTAVREDRELVAEAV